MNANAIAMFTGPVVQAIGWALLHLVWQGFVVAAILAAALALLQRQSANARYLASCGALVLLVALGIATGIRAYGPAAMPDTIAGLEPLSAAAAPATPATLLTDPGEGQPFIVTLFSSIRTHLPAVVALWLAGVLILSVRLVFGWIGAHRLVTRRAHAASSDWERSLRRIATSLDLYRRIRLLESAAVEVPTVVGWLRPIVLLPVSTISGLTVQQIEMILAHEVAHIRRHDFIVNLMQSVVETLLFYHPAVWWISRRIRVEREHCCDDLAVTLFGDPLQYAKALTRFEELRVDSQSVLAASGGSLLDRVRRLVLVRAETSNWPSRWAAGAALLTVLTAILVAPSLPLFASHDEQTPPAPPTASAPAQPAAAAAKAKAPKAKQKTPKAKCATTPVPPADADVACPDVEVTLAPDAEVDVDASTPDVEVMPVPAPTPRPMVRVMPVGPLVRESMAMAGAVSRDVAEEVAREVTAAAPAIAGLEGGIKDGVMGGVWGGVQGGIWGGMSSKPRHKIAENGKLSVDDVITLRNAGVTPKYIEEMRASGYSNLSLDDLVTLRFAGVNGEYLKGMAAAGYTNLTAKQLAALRMQDVTPAFVKSLSDAGFSNLSVNDLLRLKMSGVDADFVRELSKYRTK